MKLDGDHRTAKFLKRIALFALIIFCFAAVLSSAQFPSAYLQTEQQKPIVVTSELVAIPVSVTDGKGNFVSGLTRSNFRIFVNNEPRDITLFEQEDTPVTVGLLVDHSGSMESKLPSVVRAIVGFARSSNPQDEMFAVNFGDEAKLQLIGSKPFTSDAGEIERVVAVAASGRTALYDAVSIGLNQLRAARWQKRALVIVSDGGDNASVTKYSQVIAQARQSQVSIYAVGLVDEFGEEENPKVLEELCKDTGGIVFFPRGASEIALATSSIARDLQQQYMLGFMPEKGAETGKIQVRVSAPEHAKVRVRARPSYSAPSQASALGGGESHTP